MTALSGILENLIDGRAGLNIVTHEAGVWQKEKLHVDFHYICTTGQFSDGWGEGSGWRSRWGRVIQSQTVNVFVVRDRFFSNVHPEFTTSWQLIEVPC